LDPSSSVALAVSILEVRPFGIAWRALAARFRRVWWIWVGSAFTLPSDEAREIADPIPTPGEAAEHLPECGHFLVEVGDLDLQHLLAVQRRQIAYQVLRALVSVPDLDVSVPRFFGTTARSPAPSSRGVRILYNPGM
jgi:hypothetical protein